MLPYVHPDELRRPTERDLLPVENDFNVTLDTAMRLEGNMLAR